jgi:4-amino-4-deoxy-L-arabinose transferase-like glycosyltransferase
MQLRAVTNRLDETSETDRAQRKTSGVGSELAPLLITLVAGLVCYGLFFRRGAWLSVIGYSVSPAERVLYGEVPYRDFLYNYTPGILWLNALLMKLFGTSLLTISAGLLFIKLLTLVALFYVARRLTSSWIALVPAGLSLAWIGYKYIFGVFPTQYSMLFVLLGLICMLRYDESESRLWLLLSGILIGMVFLFKYNVGILLLGTGTLAVTVRELVLTSSDGPLSERLTPVLKRCVIYWGGFAMAAGAMALYLAYNDALMAMADHFVHHVFEYGEKRSVPLPPIKQIGPAALSLLIAAAAAALVLRKAPRLYEPFLIAMTVAGTVALLIPARGYYVKLSASAFVAYLPILLFASVAAWLVWRLRKENDLKRWWSEARRLTIVGLVALGAFLEVYPRADSYHIVRVLPPVFLLLTVVLYMAWPTIERVIATRAPSGRRAAMLSLAAPLALLTVTGIKDSWQPQFDSQFRFNDRIPLTIERAEGILVSRKQEQMIGALAGAINDFSSPGDPVFSFAQKGAGFYFLTGRRNPTRFVWWRSVGLKQEERAGIIDMISNRRLKLILLQDSLKDPRVREAVSSNYDLVRPVGDIGVFRSKDP